MNTETRIVAHRGASGDAPENTLASFELGWKQGADAIEGDYHLTRDGHVVCIHDRDTGRVAGKSVVVAESTLVELRGLDAGALREGWGEPCVIPTLTEVLATVPDGKMVYLEIKCGPEIIPPLFDDIAASGLASEQIVIISFNAEVLREIKANAPQYKAFWLVSFKRDPSGDVTPPLKTVFSTMESIAADGISAGKDGVTEAIARSVQENGYEFHVWTVDDAADAQRFKAWGAGSITTNLPAKIRAGLIVDE